MEWMKWILGGLAAMGIALFAKAQKDLGQHKIEVNSDMKELWQAISKISENRVRREDVDDLKAAMRQSASEMSALRNQMGEMMSAMGEIRGRISSGGQQ